MPAKYMKTRHQTGPMYMTWDNAKSKAEALTMSANAAQNFDPIHRASAWNTFQNVAPNVSVRDGYSNNDYYYFRKNEQTPRKQKENIKECMEAARKIGIVHNVIDLMSDFVTQGINVVHTNKVKDKVAKAWFEKVNGKERSERFSNILMRAGNTVVKMTTAKLTTRRVEKLAKTSAAPDITNPEHLSTTEKNEIPWKYTFLNPIDVEVVGDEVAAFVGVSKYVLRVPENVMRAMRSTNDPKVVELVANLPAELLSLVKSGAKYIPLPNDKTFVYHYKKDDWQTWADPIHYCILDDLIDYQKARLADRTALDAAASRIRVWKLGSLEHQFVPGPAAFVKLNDMLMALGSGGTIDIIWGPDLTVEEISTDIDKFIGSAKYEQSLRNIYAGLGIPSTLTGDGAGGFTNNAVSLKTLIERLNYVRNILIMFWNHQLRLLQKALGWKEPAKLVFDKISLTSEDAEKALLVQLADRDLISGEALMERFNLIPELENIRMKREYRKRKLGTLPEKSSPYHRTGNLEEMKKIALQRGLIRPEDVDVKSSLDTEKILMQQAIPKVPSGVPGSPKQKGQPQQGRPKNSKDSNKRKQKFVKPRSKAEFASMVAWAKESQRITADILTPVYLESCGKKNLRQLSDEEVQILEELRFRVLANLEPLKKIEEGTVAEIISSPVQVPDNVRRIYANTLLDFMTKVNAEPSIEDIRTIQAVACIIGLTEE